MTALGATPKQRGKAKVASEENIGNGVIKKTYASGAVRYTDESGSSLGKAAALAQASGGGMLAGSEGEIMQSRKRGGAGKVVAGLGVASGAMALMGGGDMGDAIGQMLPFILLEVVMTSLMMFNKQIGGWIKTMGGSVGGKAMGLLSKAGFWGMIASLVVFVVQGVFGIVRNNIKEQISKGLDTGSFMAGNQSQLVGLAEMAGTVGTTELARAEQAARVAGVENKQIDSFGLDYLGTDAGKKLQENVAAAVESGFSSAQIGSIVGTQLAEAIAQNVITKDQADSIAIRLGEAIGNAGITSQIIGQVTKLTSSKDIGSVTAGISAAAMRNFNAISIPAEQLKQPDFGTQVVDNFGTGLIASGGGGYGTGAAAAQNTAIYGIADSIGYSEEQKTELFGAQVGFAIDAYAQNQRLLDVIDAQFDSQVEELEVRKDKAKTTEEQARLEEKINDLNDKRQETLDKQRKINNDNFEAMQRSIEASGRPIDDISLEALGAKVDKLYEDMPEQAVLAKDAMNRAFGDLDNIRLGFQIASGDLDAFTAQKLTQLMVGDPVVETRYNMLIETVGDAAAIELAQSLTNSSLSDETISAVFKITTEDNVDSVTGVIQDLQAANAMSGVDFSNIDISGITAAAEEAERLRNELEASGDTTIDVIARTAGFDDVQMFIDQLGLGGQLDNLSAEQQLTYTLRVNTLLSLEGDPGMNRAFRDWQANGGVGNFNDYVYSLMGSPNAMAGPPEEVPGEYVQGGGGGSGEDPAMKKLQDKIEKRQKALDIIALKEDKINKKYDERKEALQKIADLNKEVADQQKSQLSIAEALASGDVAGAARAMQAYQEQAAQNAIAQQDRALEQSRENELDNVSFRGMDRSGLEAELADLQMQLAEMEYDRVGQSRGGGGGGGYWRKGNKPPAVDGWDYAWSDESNSWVPYRVPEPVQDQVAPGNAFEMEANIAATRNQINALENVPGMETVVQKMRDGLAEMEEEMEQWKTNNVGIMKEFSDETGLTDTELRQLSGSLLTSQQPIKDLKDKLEELGYVVGPDNTVQIGNMKVSLEQLLDGIINRLPSIQGYDESKFMSPDRIDDLRDRERRAANSAAENVQTILNAVDGMSTTLSTTPGKITPYTDAIKLSGDKAANAAANVITNSDSWFKAAGAYTAATGNMVGFNGKISDALSTTKGLPAVGSAVGKMRDNTTLLSQALGSSATGAIKGVGDLSVKSGSLSGTANAAAANISGANSKLVNLGYNSGLIKNPPEKPRFATGGFVSGPGTPTSDSIPAMLSNGEYVINAASVKKLGIPFLDSVNKLEGFAVGGPIIADRVSAPKKKLTPTRIVADRMGRTFKAPKTAAKWKPEKITLDVLGEAQSNVAYLDAINGGNLSYGKEVAGSVKNIGGGKGTGWDYATVLLAGLGMNPLSGGPSKGAALLKKVMDPRRLSDAKGTLAQYVNLPLTLHNTMGDKTRPLVDEMIQSQGHVIPKGTKISRVANMHDWQILETLKVGDKRILDRFMSVTDSSDQKFINRMISGEDNTGGRAKGGAPLINFKLKSDVPGIYDINSLFDKPLSNVVDGLLARGSSFKVKKITTGPSGNSVYDIEIGAGINAKEGFVTKSINDNRQNIFEAAKSAAQGQGSGGSSWVPSMYEQIRMEDFPRYAKGGMVIPHFKEGGYMAKGGLAQLHNNEFVMNQDAVQKYGIKKLKNMNDGKADPSSVYTYNVTVNAGGNASADDIARTVMTKLKQVENQRVRGNRY